MFMEASLLLETRVILVPLGLTVVQENLVPQELVTRAPRVSVVCLVIPAMTEPLANLATLGSQVRPAVCRIVTPLCQREVRRYHAVFLVRVEVLDIPEYLDHQVQRVRLV